MVSTYKSAVGLCILIPWSLAAAEPFQPITTITAISADSRPFQGVDYLDKLDVSYSILNLDAVSQVERQLSNNLPADEAQAKAILDDRIARIGKSQLEEDIRAAYLPLASMMTYGFDRYPVILFDQQAVVYGVTDIPQAYDQYMDWLSVSQGGEGNE